MDSVEYRALLRKRDLGTPVTMGPRFTRRGLLSHQQRMILLDVAIRTYINDPIIEMYADDSVRYYCAANYERVADYLDNVDFAVHLIPYGGLKCVTMYSPICVNCLEPYTAHERGKCLFQSTTWQEIRTEDIRSAASF